MNTDEVREQTIEHIKNVQKFLKIISDELEVRGKQHDKSKLEEPEFPIFCEYTEKLKTTTYGSDEYSGYLKEMSVALDHHYDNNRHHPEHFPFGIDDMNIVDLIEMFCDWKAASLRHDDGDITKSIEFNKDRFDMSDQLENIFMNSVGLLEGK